MKRITKDEMRKCAKEEKWWERELKDLLFPLHCPICDGVIPHGKGRICQECVAIPRPVKAPRCICCGKHINKMEQVRCRDCSGMQKNFERGVALYEYSSVHDSIHRFKNLGRMEYALFYGEELRKWLTPVIEGMHADALVPIPLHPTKLRSRGYNQATLLAEEISKGCNIPVREDILVRTQKTAAQKTMNHAERQNNMKKAFHMVQNDVKLNTIILVDDVFTTGNTLDAAAAELKRGGIKQVFFITLAIGEGL